MEKVATINAFIWLYEAQTFPSGNCSEISVCGEIWMAKELEAIRGNSQQALRWTCCPATDNIWHHSTAGPPFSTTTILKRWVEEVERKAKNKPGLCLYSSSLFLVLSLANAHQLLSVVILWSRPYRISVLKSVTQEKHLVAAVLKDRAWNRWPSQTTDQWKVTLTFENSRSKTRRIIIIIIIIFSKIQKLGTIKCHIVI